VLNKTALHNVIKQDINKLLIVMVVTARNVAEHRSFSHVCQVMPICSLV